MARWAPLKRDQLEALATEILHNYGRGRVVIAVDGASGTGTTGFADDLADTIRTLGHETFRASIDDFQAPRTRREPDGGFSAEAFYRNGFDYSLLQRVLLDPFRATSGTGFVLAAFDAARDVALQSKWTTAGPDAILIVEGRFLNRDELATRWNYSIWVEVEPEGTTPGSAEAADAIYLAEVGPRGKASAIIDNTDPEHPRRRFGDSC